MSEGDQETHHLLKPENNRSIKPMKGHCLLLNAGSLKQAKKKKSPIYSVHKLIGKNYYMYFAEDSGSSMAQRTDDHDTPAKQVASAPGTKCSKSDTSNGCI